ncbi:MMPL family transporter [Kitasatospora viridis]|uniref:RND superfamily putative drug exporter n=1 Tax=Kitasatospora viridis TaxID=281105 RepID=A0A561UG16_9ACTN|nr:MMPL family transporter [Kitasatospora viridis]TWF98313.1 RND superfamily putative drug exporter [Kitasatospora viridis]
MSLARPAAPDAGGGLLARLAAAVLARPRAVLALAALLTVLTGVFGLGAHDRLALGGNSASTGDAVRADRWLGDHGAVGDAQLELLVATPDGVDSAASRQAGAAFTRLVAGQPGVRTVLSYWPSGPAALRSTDGRSALLLVRTAGDAVRSTESAARLGRSLSGRHGPLSVSATGTGPNYGDVMDQVGRDTRRAELFGSPLTLLILVAALGSLVAGLLPVAVGALAAAGTMAVLRLLTGVMAVSVLSENLTTTLGFGLAVDYCLFVVHRYREELAGGADPHPAVVTAIRTAGRTVVFSALTVALCSAGLLLVPVPFLRAMAATVVVVVLLAAAAALTVLPALLAVLGGHLDRLDPFAAVRRRLRRGAARPGFWHRLATRVVRHPLPWCLGAGLLLLALAVPAGHFRTALSDYRVLPASAPVSVTARAIGAGFDPAELAPTSVVLPDAPARDALAGYAARLARLPGVTRVDTVPGGWLSVVGPADSQSPEAERLVRLIRAVPAPGTALVGGRAAELVDTQQVLTDRLPWVALVVVLAMGGLLLLFSGSVLIAVKALLLSALSLTAVLGAMVAVFQDGHARWLVGGAPSYGQLEVTTPVLVLFLAFGLSIDYELFVISRIREEFRRTDDLARSITSGIGSTGGLISSAAAVVAVLLVVLAASELSLNRMFGAALALALLLDATVVRGVLVPAVMRLSGRANWWAPAGLGRLQQRLAVD